MKSKWKDNFWKWLIIGTIIIFLDFSVFILLGLGMMRYDDFYGSIENYGNWNTMNNFDKKIYISFVIWTILNLIGFVYLAYRIYQTIKNKKSKTFSIKSNFSL